MSRERGNAIVGESCVLGIRFTQDGLPFDPASISKCEILNPAGVVVQTITSITRAAPGDYTVAVSGTILATFGLWVDLWEYTLRAGEAVRQTRQDFYVSEVYDSAGTDATAAELTEDRVRLFMRDRSSADNFLLDDLEFDSDMVALALQQAVEEYNEWNEPQTSFTVATFPHRHGLIKGVKAYLYSIVVNNYMRNELAYEAGGVRIADKAKFSVYQQMADRYYQEWIAWMTRSKRKRNVQRGFATLSGR